MTKNDFRKSCKELLSKSRAQKVAKDYIILQRLLEIIEKEKPKNILLFVPLKTEPNVLKLINTLRKRRGTKVFVPFMMDKSFKPVLYRLPLANKNFGIKEPKFAKPTKREKIDLAIVPTLGFDATFRRVGFGKGMYDRYFETISNDIKIVFVQRELCYASNILTQTHDIRADYIVSS
jgi:5-formyltetrahydrofolate cyclo-ligase